MILLSLLSSWFASWSVTIFSLLFAVPFIRRMATALTRPGD